MTARIQKTNFVRLERGALTGRHSRFDTVDFGGATWLELVKSPGGFPSTATSVGLGRAFTWNHWAWKNEVVDKDFKVRRGDAARFLAEAAALRGNDNALDVRSKPHRVIEITDLRHETHAASNDDLLLPASS